MTEHHHQTNSFESLCYAIGLMILFAGLWMLIWPNDSKRAINGWKQHDVIACNKYLAYARTPRDTLDVVLTIKECRQVVMPTDTLKHK